MASSGSFLSLLRAALSDFRKKSYIWRHVDPDESLEARFAEVKRRQREVERRLDEFPWAGEQGKQRPPTSAEADSDGAPKIIANDVKTVNPQFKLIFQTVFLLTLLGGAGFFAIAFLVDGPLSDRQDAAFTTLRLVFELGVGAIFGLIGGKWT